MVDNNELEINLLEIINAVKRKVFAVLVATVVGAIVGMVLSCIIITPLYEASANMIVNTRSETATTVTNDNITSAKNLVNTYAIIIKSNVVLNKVIDKLNLNMTHKELSEKITVSAVNATQIMKVSVQDPDPVLAGQIVEQISVVAPEIIVDAVEAGSCKVISEVEIGDKPVSPSVVKYVVLFSFIGMVISISVVVMKELFSNYIEDDTDVQKKLGLPVLGVIPEVEDAE